MMHLDTKFKSGNVLIVVENSWVPVDRRVWYEATSLRDAGWKVTIICPAAMGAHAGTDEPEWSSMNNPEILDGITVYRFPLSFAEHGISNYLREYISAFVWITRLSWRVWHEEPFDILHICNPPDIFFPLGYFYRLLGVKFVFDHHDLFPENILWRYRSVSGRLLYAFARAAEFLTLRGANIVISTNESYRKIALQRGRIREKKVIVVRNGPKISEFVPVEPDLSLKRGFPFMVCFVGVMGNEDGIIELTETIRYIVRDVGRRDILFSLIGDGASRPRALANVKTWGMDAFVDMPGMILDDGILRKYMSTADVFVSPEPLTPMNTYSTFVKIGEYMAIGRPIVAYDLSETRYTGHDAVSYVRPGDVNGFGKTIVSLLDDPDRRQQMGEFGRQRILNELGWEYQKRHLFQAYAMALGTA